jgi:predicted GIY-YIG superfamily endonuclease
MTPIIYILHFHERIHHAQHYVGSTTNLFQRITAHRNGTAARLTEVIHERKIQFTVAALYAPRERTDNIRQLEIHVKRMKNGHRYCPICNPAAVSPRGLIQIPIPKEINE